MPFELEDCTQVTQLIKGFCLKSHRFCKYNACNLQEYKGFDSGLQIHQYILLTHIPKSMPFPDTQRLNSGKVVIKPAKCPS
ncbi:hypothetical protein vseg_009143 [Gypsophila vaccaria]